MNVDRVPLKRVHDFCQCQIVCCHNSNGSVVNQLPDNAFRSDAAIMRVGSLQDLIQ